MTTRSSGVNSPNLVALRQRRVFITARAPGTVPAVTNTYFPTLRNQRSGPPKRRSAVYASRRRSDLRLRFADYGRYLFPRRRSERTIERSLCRRSSDSRLSFGPVFTGFRHLQPDEIGDGTMYLGTETPRARGRGSGVDVRPVRSKRCRPDGPRDHSNRRISWNGSSLVHRNRSLTTHTLHRSQISTSTGGARIIDLPGWARSRTSPVI